MRLVLHSQRYELLLESDWFVLCRFYRKKGGKFSVFADTCSLNVDDTGMLVFISKQQLNSLFICLKMT